MSQQAHGIALASIAAGADPGAPFAVERSQTAGTPALWHEVISVEAGESQHYLRVRSQADEGGAPIGRWSAPAMGEQVQALAQALCDAAIWTLASEPVAPGEELITWRWVTAAGVGSLSVPAGSGLLSQLAPLDLVIRKVANALVRIHAGAELSCQVSLVERDGATEGSVWLVNEGDRDCLVLNPLHPTGRGSDFFRLEMGHLPDEQPGVTGLGIQYAAMPMVQLDAPPPPWDNPYLLLRSGDMLECPTGAPLSPPRKGRHFLRAVYSRYGDEHEIGGVPVIRGRAFSEEHELQQVDGAVQIKGAPGAARREGDRSTLWSTPEGVGGPQEPDLLRTAVEGAPALDLPPPEAGPPPRTEESSEPPAPADELLKTRLDE